MYNIKGLVKLAFETHIDAFLHVLDYGDPDFDDLIKLLKKHPGCWISKKDNHEGHEEATK